MDGDVDVYLYGSDGYTVLSGFPISLKAAQRSTTSAGDHILIFPTKPTLEANTFYRLIVVPTTATSISLTCVAPADDGGYSGIDNYPEGGDVIYTERATAPSSGDYAWTDANYKPAIAVVIDGIDAGSSGGLIIHPGMNGGLNG
jgi:hypothetical protein